MPEINLSQTEADAFIVMPKVPSDSKSYDYPGLGGSIKVDLASRDNREKFILDVNRYRIKLQRCTYQNRVHQVVILLRLDLEGPPHRNPDDEWIGPNHLHTYREGYGDKWAKPIPSDKFTDTADLWKTLEEFMVYCNIVERPDIRRGLFT